MGSVDRRLGVLCIGCLTCTSKTWLTRFWSRHNQSSKVEILAKSVIDHILMHYKQMRGHLCVLCLSGQRWSFTWWSALLMAPLSGFLPPHSSVIWSRPTLKSSSHKLELPCPSHAQSSLQHSSNTCCKMLLQVNACLCQPLANSTTCWECDLMCWMMLLPPLTRCWPHHLGAGQGG